MEETTFYSDRVKDLVAKINNGEITLSYSALSRFKRSPKSFIQYKLDPKEQTDAMKQGTLVHCLVLQPEEFADRYVVDLQICNEIGGAKPRATNKYKEWVAAQTKIIIRDVDYNEAMAMAASVRANPAARRLLDMVEQFEQHITFELNGFKFQAFLDGIGSIIIDLKICTDAEPRKFAREIINMGYYLQGGGYEIAVGEMLPYYIIAVDRAGGVSVHELGDDLIEYGMNEFVRLTDEFKQCIEKGSWHSSFEYRAPNPNGVYHVPRPPFLP